MTHSYSFDDLKRDVASGSVDTVVAYQVDMQGRMMGKRFQARHFVNGGYEETHGCNYLMATDLEMATVQGYKSTSWAAGYGDYTMKPDLSTLRPAPWLDATVLVQCDTLDHHGHHEIAHAPRSILKKQIARLEALGMKAMMATELEFYLFRDSYENNHADGYHNLKTLGIFNSDYNINLTTREEGVMRALRNNLADAGIPVENSKGEASAGQNEINIRYAEALQTADMHVIVKSACKDIAWKQGRSVTFMAKYKTEAAGSSSHIHQSLWSQDGKIPLFLDKSAEHGMSELMRQYVAGLLHHATDVTWFLAPYVNSYKRFTEGLFAPTKAIWSADNRTVGYRVCGADTKAVRIECRVGGSDLNPYLAMASQLAAGLDGIEKKMKLEPAFVGDAYAASKVREIPRTLREAAAAMHQSKMLRAAFGDDVIDHYHHNAMWEQHEFDRKVTDWEVQRGFDRA